jgi:hypothetical protein
VYDVEQTNDVWVIQLPLGRDFADGSARDSLVLVFKADHLERDDATRVEEISGFVDYAVCSFEVESLQVFMPTGMLPSLTRL